MLRGGVQVHSKVDFPELELAFLGVELGMEKLN